jgi:hypothetical protein
MIQLMQRQYNAHELLASDAAEILLFTRTYRQSLRYEVNVPFAN